MRNCDNNQSTRIHMVSIAFKLSLRARRRKGNRSTNLMSGSVQKLVLHQLSREALIRINTEAPLLDKVECISTAQNNHIHYYRAINSYITLLRGSRCSTLLKLLSSFQQILVGPAGSK